MHWFRGSLTGPARRLTALSVLLITVTILLAGCGGGASGVSSGIAPYMMALWLFGLSAVSLFFTGCGGENNGVPGFGQSTVTSTSSSSSSTSGGSTFQAIPTSLTFANTPGSIAQPVSHAATALTKLPPVQVDILDQNGHLDTNATNLVTISLGANPSHATLKGTLTKAAVGGVATFDDLELTLAGSGFTLVASSPGLKGATSSAFSVSALPTNLGYIDRQDYQVGQGPVVPAIGDLNGDGNADVVVTGDTSKSVSVLLGNGDGSFAPAVNYALPHAGAHVNIVDVNGDGHPDLIVSTYANGGEVSVLLGNGNGTFQPAITTDVSANGNNSQGPIAVGDFNGDGKPDVALVTSHYYGYCSAFSHVSILLGNGDGHFQVHSNAFALNSNEAYGIVAADFNGDSHLDLAVNDYCNHKVMVLLGNGDGTFQHGSKQIDTSLNGGGAELLAAADLNGDGHADLVVSDYYNSEISNNSTYPYPFGAVQVLIGNGDGTFHSPINYATPGATDAVAIGDVDGDGVADVIATNYTYYSTFPFQTTSVLLGQGDGTFRAAVNYESGPGAFGVAVGDVNNDGKADVAVANYDTSTVSLLLGTQGGLLSPSSPLPLPIVFETNNGNFDNRKPASVAIADLNGDGISDFVVVGDHSAVSVFLGVGQGSFQSPITFSLANNADKDAFDLTLIDVNNDGKLDLVVAHPEAGQVSVALGNGDGTFQHARQTNMPLGQAANLAVSDFNNDGKPDLAVTSYYDGKVQVLLGNGDGTFQAFVNIDPVLSANLLGVAVGDFNKDGNEDIAVCDYTTNSVKVLLGNGDGTFQSPTSFFNGDSNAGTEGVTVADVNGDGHLDLVTVNYYQSVSVLLGNGDGTFQAGVCYSIGNPINDEGNMRQIVVADVNADGVPDIVVPNYYDCNVQVLIGNGDGSFQTPVALGAGANPRSVAVGDLNGDGKVDFVTADFWGYTSTIIFHQ